MKRVLFVILILIYATISYGCFERKNDVNKEIDELEEIDNIENNKIADVQGDTYLVTNEDELTTGLKENYSVTIKNNITANNDLVMEGDFLITDTTEKHKVRVVKRRLNFSYNNANYTITSPKLIIKSNHTILKDGIYVGNMYIEASDVIFDNFRVEGNVFFKDEKVKKSFRLENGSSVTGKLILE